MSEQNISESYCAYLRKSRADKDAELRGEEETLKRHHRILTEYAEKNGIVISRFYKEVVSGDTIEDRPVMQELLKDVESGKWNGVLVVEVERLARGNTKDQGIVADAFKYSDTKIITPSKTYDPDNEFDEEYFEFGLFMSRREYKTINRRLQRGRISSVREGNFVGGTAPFGYQKVKIPHEKGYTLEPVPSEAEIVRKIFEWYCYGETLPDGSVKHPGTDSIALKLDCLGIKPSAGDHWSKATLSDMLKNKTYAGYVFFGKQKEVKTSAHGKIVRIRKTNPDYICVKGKHPAVISEELFELAQAIRKENRTNTLPSHAVLQNALSGIVHCKKCGRLMTRLAPNSRNRYSTLKCPNRYCDNVSSPIFLVEQQILLFLEDWVKSYELDNGLINTLPVQRQIADKQAMMQKLNAGIAAFDVQMNKIYDLLEQGVYTVEVFRQRQKILTENRKQQEESLAALLEESNRLEQLWREQELFLPRVRHLLDTCHTNTAEVNNRILHEIIESIYYEKTAPNHRGQLCHANFKLEIYPKLPGITPDRP